MKRQRERQRGEREYNVEKGERKYNVEQYVHLLIGTRCNGCRHQTEREKVKGEGRAVRVGVGGGGGEGVAREERGVRAIHSSRIEQHAHLLKGTQHNSKHTYSLCMSVCS